MEEHISIQDIRLTYGDNAADMLIGNIRSLTFILEEVQKHEADKWLTVVERYDQGFQDAIDRVCRYLFSKNESFYADDVRKFKPDMEEI